VKLAFRNKAANAIYDFWKDEIKKTNGRICDCKGIKNCTDLSCASIRLKIGDIVWELMNAEEKK